MRLQTRRGDAATRARLEAYYDAAPRASARVEDFGALTLFIRTNPGWPFYGRPALRSEQPVTLDALRTLLARQRELQLPLTLEWVNETTPGLDRIATAAGLTVSRHPLMIFDPVGPIADEPTEHSQRSARVLDPADPGLATAIAAAHLAFAEPNSTPNSAIGPETGPTPFAELHNKAAELQVDGWLAGLSDRMRAGRAVVAAAFDGDSIAVCSGQHNPIGDTTEIVGVGTLASVRGRGYAQDVTRTLVADARERGIETIFLSAGDETVARIYARIGFRLIGTALVAEGRSDQ